jgi:processed acidic surface protein
MLSIFELKADFSLIQNGVETSVSLKELFQLKDLKDTDLKVVLSNKDSQFLADLVIKSDLAKSLTSGSVIEQSAKEIIKTVDQNYSSKPDTTTADVPKTVKGGKLPKTASGYLDQAILGIFIACTGILVFRKVRNVKGETIK